MRYCERKRLWGTLIYCSGIRLVSSRKLRKKRSGEKCIPGSGIDPGTFQIQDGCVTAEPTLPAPQDETTVLIAEAVKGAV
jgi:hypothetical protein